MEAEFGKFKIFNQKKLPAKAPPAKEAHATRVCEIMALPAGPLAYKANGEIHLGVLNRLPYVLKSAVQQAGNKFKAQQTVLCVKPLMQIRPAAKSFAVALPLADRQFIADTTQAEETKVLVSDVVLPAAAAGLARVTRQTIVPSVVKNGKGGFTLTIAGAIVNELVERRRDMVE